MSRLPILMSRISRSILTLVVFSFVTVTSSFSAETDTTKAAPAATPALSGKGEQLFKENCKSCHKVHEESVGPALSGVSKRRSADWLHSWVKNNAVFRASGDKDAIAIYEKYKKAEMTAFPTFTNEDIDAIIAYVESVPVEDQDPNKGKGQEVVGDPKEKGGEYDTIILGLIVVVLVLVLVAMFIFLAVIKRYLKEKEANLDAEDKELVNQKFDVKAFVRSKAFIAIVVILFICISVRACWIGAQEVAVEQNYAPVQPIAFSHKLHAGDNQINCNYCHTGAYKGKQSNIPSLNICMNCHTYIKKGPTTGEGEIKKLTDAYAAGTPIKWVRVHNLPDLAYFNHSQHTQVAGLECQKCHGPIEEMEVVKQYSNLTMGWCINCHRETAVNGKDNAYYDRLLKVHEESKKKTDMTAEEIGGLDCSKCHY